MDMTRQIQIAVVRTDIALTAAGRFLQSAIPVAAALIIAAIVIVWIDNRG